MKKTLIASAVVLGACVITPKIISGQIAPSLESIVSSIDENPAYKAKIKSKQIGWFSSTAVIEVSLDMAALRQANEDEMSDSDEPLVFDIDFAASHGPITTLNGLGLNLVDWSVSYKGDAQREFIKWQDDQPLYSIKSQTSVFGNGTFSDEAPAFTAVENEDNLTASFSGHQGSGSYDAESYQYHGSAGKLTITDGNFQLDFDELSMDMSAKGNFVEILGGAMFDSSFSAILKKVSFENKKLDQTFSLTDMLLSSEAKMKEDGKLADIAAEYRIAKMELNDFVGSDLELRAAVNNLNVEFMQAYQKLSQEILGADPQETEAKMMAFVRNNVLKALTPQPELNITSFKGVIPQGKFNLTADSKIVGIDAMPANLVDPAFWLSHIAANAQFAADEAVVDMLAAQQLSSQLMASPQGSMMSAEEIEQIVVQQTPVLLDNLTQQGLLIKTEEGYRSKFTMADGQASINETPIPLPGM